MLDQLMRRIRPSRQISESQIGEAEQFLHFASDPYFKILLQELEQLALTDGLDTTDYEGALMSVGRRQAYLNLKTRLETKINWARDVLNLAITQEEEDDSE